MVSKLAKTIFSKEVTFNNVVGIIEDFIQINNLDKKKVYESLSSELMKLKASSVYLNSELIKREIIAEVNGVIKYLNSSATQDEVFYIIGPNSINVNSLLNNVNTINETSASENELHDSLKELKQSLLNEGIDIKVMSDYKNQKNISRLNIANKQGDEVQINQSIGYFEDFEFNNTAREYMTKYAIVDQYCSSLLINPVKTKVSDKPSKVEEIKNMKLNQIWSKKEIAKYDQFISLLKEINTLPDYTPETSIAFITENNEGKLKWNKTPTKGWQRYLAGFLRVLGNNDFIEINNYSASQLISISINTFLDEKDTLSNDAFLDSKNDLLEEKYLLPFKKLIKRLK